MSDWADGVLGTAAAGAAGGLPGIALSVGGRILGGLFGKRSADNQAAQNAALQREFAQNSIRWRVADAKAAGVHPLFAMGGPSATYSPAPITTHMADAISGAGQDLSRAVTAQASQPERQILQHQLVQSQASASRDFAMASYYRSLEARNIQSLNNAAPIPMEDIQDPGDQVRAARWASYSAPTAGVVAPSASPRSGVPDRVVPKPDEVVSPRSGDPGVSAGSHTSSQEVILPNGVPMLVPRTNDMDVPYSVQAYYILANIQRYGSDWPARALGLRKFGWTMEEAVSALQSRAKDADRSISEFSVPLPSVRSRHNPYADAYRNWQKGAFR